MFKPAQFLVVFQLGIVCCLFVFSGSSGGDGAENLSVSSRVAGTLVSARFQPGNLHPQSAALSAVSTL